MPRFSILLHETPRNHQRPTHWDLMLEDGDALATWALEDEPSPAKSIAAELLAPHRLDYLEYEGPVSRNRGVVTQWDAGTFHWQVKEEHHIVIALSGSRINGVATLRQQDGLWHFSLS